MTPDENARLAFGSHGGLDRQMRDDLERMRLDALLAEKDRTADLTRDVEETLRGPLAVAELGGLLDRLEEPVLAELAGMLAAPGGDALPAEQQLLTSLLQDGGDARTLLEQGMRFLRHRRWADAVEWWSLNRMGLQPAGNPSASRLQLLLLIMEALTHSWSGNRPAAAATREAITAHPLYRAMTGESNSATRP